MAAEIQKTLMNRSSSAVALRRETERYRERDKKKSVETQVSKAATIFYVEKNKTIALR